MTSNSNQQRDKLKSPTRTSNSGKSQQSSKDATSETTSLPKNSKDANLAALSEAHQKIVDIETQIYNLESTLLKESHVILKLLNINSHLNQYF